MGAASILSAETPSVDRVDDEVPRPCRPAVRRRVGTLWAVHEWLIAASEKLGSEVGDDASQYALSQDEIDELLELARVASHESGERINAPLVCYLVGVARARHGVALDELVDAVIGKRV